MTEQKKPPYGNIAILFMGAFVAIFTQTLLNIALPSIMTDLNIKDASTVQWLVTGYMLVNGILIPASAYFIQRYSNRSIFILAMSIFALGTLFAGLAPTFGVLLAARMIQAAGAALMMPLLMNVMLAAFPVERRGAAMGVFGLVMIVAPAIGPTLSGYIVEHYSWRVLFFIVLPVALIPLALGIFKLKNLTFQNRELSLDKMSLVFSSLGFGGILYGFSSAGQNGWDDPIVLGTITVGVVSLVTFILRQLKLSEPLLEFRIYKHPMFALSSAISIVLSISMFSAMILMPIYVQTIKGISPFDSGLLMLPGALVMGFMSPVTGKLFDKYGAKVLAITGMSIVVISTYYFSKLSLDTTYLEIMFLYTIRMFGISMVMMPVMTNGLNTLPMKAYPHGTAMNNTFQQVSGAIGSALLITVMNTRTTSTAENLAKSGSDPMNIMKNSMMEGITYTFYVSTFIAVVGLALTFFIKKPNRQVTEEEKEQVYKQKPVEE
ncbi:drug:H+ antiporter-2 (14 Spanner) (DHA2) family drug resistance MFS transporter [Paenisporosarcina sp. HGH0030]|uniref:MDR family MFS transporter n=1 Tax=Paenisporosarcina sp. HGH0030 TaxID=1078085 RepID=UPI00034E1943|nr:MDR family MFS transporter [Paenisporosarcina sp. HGH0030]EPD51537.1 drug:H+ antiporter-2 (14 Spanner) (DHA2) family drug resistance MFS transporter [Paenisporosarcina sp. HGH0030]